ncbi:MAG: low-specificity L-threonine aldolase [Pseudomonadota bacterium]
MYASPSPSVSASNRTIDLRSDTVTQPSAGMRAAMAAADVGDDVYGEDPTVLQLESRMADLFGKEAAILMPSGTQSNLAALLCHCARGEEVIVGDRYHAFKYEAGGASVLGGIVACPLPTNATGGLNAAQVEAAVKPDDSHFAITRLLSLENTVSGYVQPLESIDALCAIARRHGLSLHLDGARVWNAAIALEESLVRIAEPFDTVSACLSKGLGAPAGTVLVGNRALIDKARRVRKMLGGGMRQVGLLAAAGLYALDHNYPRMAEDHENAAAFASGLAGIDALDVQAGPTNMVFLAPHEGDRHRLVEHLSGQGIRIGAPAEKIRVVFHHDVSRADVDRAIEGVHSYYDAA